MAEKRNKPRFPVLRHHSQHEAENVLSAEVIAMKIQQAILAKLPQIIRESVKPMERIDGIKIVHVGGLNGEGAPGNGEMPQQPGNN